MTWETFAFRDLFTIKHRFAFKSESFANHGSFVVLTPGHFAEVGGFRYRNGSEKYYLGCFPEEYLLEEGSLLVVMTEQAPGLLGSSILIPEGNKYLHNQRLGLVQEIEYSRICKEFLYHLFNGHSVRKQISLMAGGTKVLHTSPTKILDVHIDLPSLPEQKKIAKILNCWDRAIAQTAKLIEAKQKLKKSLIQQLLTGKQRFPGFRETWPEKKLGEVFRERKETDCPELSLLSVTGDQGVIPHSETGRKDSSAEDKSKYKRIAPGDIGYNTMRMWQGVSALSCLEGIVSPAYTICIPKQDIDGSFAAHLFKFPPVVHLFHRYSQGLVSDTLNLKFPHFAQVTVDLPPLSEQKKIATVLNSLDREIVSLVALSGRIKEQKRGLMQKLLTGQIRVKATEEITA